MQPDGIGNAMGGPNTQPPPVTAPSALPGGRYRCCRTRQPTCPTTTASGRIWGKGNLFPHVHVRGQGGRQRVARDLEHAPPLRAPQRHPHRTPSSCTLSWCSAPVASSSPTSWTRRSIPSVAPRSSSGQSLGLWRDTTRSASCTGTSSRITSCLPHHHSRPLILGYPYSRSLVCTMFRCFTVIDIAVHDIKNGVVLSSSPKSRLLKILSS